LTNQQTIQGAGFVGNNQLTLVNTGTIDANDTTSLVVNPSGGTTKTGTLEATSGGTLDPHHSGNKQTGPIHAPTGAGGVPDGAAVSGGTLSTAGTGVIQSLGATLDGAAHTVTTAGTLQIPNGQTLTLAGTIGNSGSLQENSAGSTTELLASGAVALTGGGTL